VEKLKAEKKEFFDYIICNDSFLNMIAVSGFIIIINPEAMSDEEIKSFNECFEEAENTIIVSTRDFKRRKNFPIYFNIAIDIGNPLCHDSHLQSFLFLVTFDSYFHAHTAYNAALSNAAGCHRCLLYIRNLVLHIGLSQGIGQPSDEVSRAYSSLEEVGTAFC